MATEPDSLPKVPPTHYRLDEVNLRLSTSASRGPSPQRVSLSGAGNGRLERGERHSAFPFPAERVRAALNELYRLRFFELPENFTTRYSVFQKADGSLGIQADRPADAPVTTLCVALGRYEKCVRFNENGPRELTELARALLSEAEQAASAAPPPTGH